MKRILLPGIAAIGVGLAVLAACLVLTAGTEAGGIYHNEGSGASASFYSEEGTVATYVDVYANDYVDQSPPGKPHKDSGASICIHQEDSSTREVLLDACGWTSLPESAFQIDKGLKNASLDAVISVCPWWPPFSPTPEPSPSPVEAPEVSPTPPPTPTPGPCFDVSVDLEWIGGGELSRQSSHTHYHSPEFKDNWHCNNAWRPATATGSVSDGVTNFTPAPATWAEMSAGKCGGVTIG